MLACVITISTFQLQIYGDHLDSLKSKKVHLWRLLEAIVCKDVTRKLYQMNEGFERMSKQREKDEQKALIKMSVRSVSLEALDINSKGWNVSDNWLQADNRNLMLGMLLFPALFRFLDTTLRYLINVQCTLINFPQKSSMYALIKDL